ncbi:MAG: hypothetical protein NVV73_05860 [Cellvibrionaceae bacterium]|nr:hypothetical protein [Cellvibrionaceae bacterium]
MVMPFTRLCAKGGVHEKSNKAKRAAAKQQTSRKVQEWFGRSSLSLPHLFLVFPHIFSLKKLPIFSAARPTEFPANLFALAG